MRSIEIQLLQRPDFVAWLNSLDEPMKYSIRFDTNSRYLIIQSHDRVAIDDAQQRSEELASLGLFSGVKLFWKTEQYDRLNFRFPEKTIIGSDELSINSMIDTINQGQALSSWVQHNKNVFEILPATAIVHSASIGFKYLAVRPDLGIEDRLNKPIIELLGQPADIVDSGIAEKRIWAIDQVARSGGSLKYDYDFSWNGLLWQFNVSVSYLPGHDEVLAIVEDADPNQRWYWLNKIN